MTFRCCRVFGWENTGGDDYFGEGRVQSAVILSFTFSPLPYLNHQPSTNKLITTWEIPQWRGMSAVHAYIRHAPRLLLSSLLHLRIYCIYQVLDVEEFRVLCGQSVNSRSHSRQELARDGGFVEKDSG